MAARRVHKPIWGFGWVGWIASAVLVGLVFAVLSGVDLQHLTIVAVFRLLGIDAVNLFVSTTTPFTWFAIIGNQPSPLLLAWIAIGWHLAGSRIPWWAWLSMALACCLAPSLLIWSYTIDPIKAVYTWSPINRMHTFLLVHCVVLAAIGIAFSLFCRTRMSVTLWVVAIAVSVTEIQLVMRNVDPPYWAPAFAQRAGIILSVNPFNVTIHALLIAASLHAGIVNRKLLARDGCETCGYSRTGLAPNAACPECGATPAASPSPSPPPAPPPRGRAP